MVAWDRKATQHPGLKCKKVLVQVRSKKLSWLDLPGAAQMTRAGTAKKVEKRELINFQRQPFNVSFKLPACLSIVFSWTKRRKNFPRLRIIIRKSINYQLLFHPFLKVWEWELWQLSTKNSELRWSFQAVGEKNLQNIENIAIFRRILSKPRRFGNFHQISQCRPRRVNTNRCQHPRSKIGQIKMLWIQLTEPFKSLKFDLFERSTFCDLVFISKRARGEFSW